jgi:hypothetical protein
MSQMPTGGLGSFLTSNMDEIDDNILAFGKGQGINSMSKIANRMANMGRNGDNQLVHVKTGELIVSPEILEKNPKLAKELTQSFQNMDENIGDYVVGSDGNSINPMTGQREFFLKGLVKGIKNIFSKVAGFVLPGLLGFIPGFAGLSPVLKGAITGGIGGLLSGKGVKGALQGAALGGLGTGLYKGFTSAMGDGTFTEGFKGAFQAPSAAPTPAFELRDKVIKREVANDPSDIRNFGLPPTRTITETIQERVPVTPPTQGTTGGKSFFDKILPSQPDISSGEFLVQKQKYIDQGFSNTEAFDRAMRDLKPGLMDYAPAAGIALAGIGALGGFDTPDQTMPDPYGGVTSTDLVKNNPELYRVLFGGLRPPRRTRMEDTVVPTPDPFLFEKYLDPKLAAKGGEMFPRKTGAINGPGTETSDDVPAMLSDGEFVMTARAVRGLGDGSRKQGIKKMYDMMKNFERSVPA